MRSMRLGFFMSIWLLYYHNSNSSSLLSQFNCRYPSTNVDETIYFRKKSTRPFVFSSSAQCECEHDWRDAFCLRAEHYRNASADTAPAICICRRFSSSGDSMRKCMQFLVRCFADNNFDGTVMVRRNDTNVINAVSHIPPQRCACCFNQPDEFCGHVECAGMRPRISEYSSAMNGGGGRSEYSCVCLTQADYPYAICGDGRAGRPGATVFDDHAVNIPPRLSIVTPMSRVVANSFRIHNRRTADGGPAAASASMMASADRFTGGGVALVASVAATLAVLTAFGCFLSVRRISRGPRLKMWYHQLRARVAINGNDNESEREHKKSQVTPSVERVDLSINSDGDTIGRSSRQPPTFFTVENNMEMLLV